MPRRTTSTDSAPHHYDDDFKAGAVRLVTEQKRTVKQAAADLGIHPDTLKNWIRSASGTSDERSEPNRIKELEATIRELRREIAVKNEEIEILKKASGIFLKR